MSLECRSLFYLCDSNIDKERNLARRVWQEKLILENFIVIKFIEIGHNFTNINYFTYTTMFNSNCSIII